MSVSFGTLNPMTQNSHGTDPPIWISAAMSLHKRKQPLPNNIDEDVPAPSSPYGALRLLLNYPDSVTATSKIHLNILLNAIADQELPVSIKVGESPPYMTTVAGLWPTVTIELDELQTAPRDPNNPQSMTLGLFITAGTEDSFTYIEVDGTIIP